MDEDQRIGQLLLREGVITEDDLNRALEAQNESYNKPLGEVMMELNIISEPDFLRILAKKFHTQYLTTQKLSEIKVPETVLKLVPEATAEKYQVFPVQYKKSNKLLTVVMTNPDDVAAVDEVKFVSGIGNVKALVGLKEAIKAAITKWYKRDDNAFSMLEGMDEVPGYEIAGGGAQELEQEDSPLDLSSLVSPRGGEEKAGEQEAEDSDKGEVYLGGISDAAEEEDSSPGGLVIEEVTGEEPVEVEEVTVGERSPAAEPGAAEEELEAKPVKRPDAKKYRLRMLMVEPHDSIRKFISKLFGHEGFKVKGVKTREEALQELEIGEYDSLVIKDRDLGEGEEFANTMLERFPDVELCSIKDYGSAVIGETRAHKRLMSSFLETMDVVMGLLEMEGGGIQGHSHNMAKYAKLIAGKLDLLQREVDTIALAAYIHELGKKGIPHRSLLSLEKEEVDPDLLMEQVEIPLKLLSSAKIPLEVSPILRHQYERWDGKGVPDGLQGEDIPPGSRILALVEAFEDLTNKHTGTENVDPTAALEAIKNREQELFDPSMVEIFLGVVRDDIYLQQMSTAQQKLMVVDTEPDLVTLLELRLVNMGFAVTTASTAEDAMEKAKAELPSMIITEVELPDMSGLSMIEQLKAEPDLRDLHFIFISRKDDSASVNKGFQMGADDFIIKPVKVEILGAKINTMMSRLQAEKKTAPAAAGVSGSLSEMGLPDIVQILGAGRKTGRITLEDNGRTCYIDMEEGQVVNASIDDIKGEDAFYKILYWTKGSFSIDPEAEISERLINISNDSLMLEGFRRMDEEAAGAGPEDDIAMDGSDFF